jgi:hypothetical protein
MTDIARSASGFDLTPPTDAERERLEADLTPQEAEVLLHHGTEAPFCGGLLGEKRPRGLLLPPVRFAAVPLRDQVRERHRLAQLLCPL